MTKMQNLPLGQIKWPKWSYVQVDKRYYLIMEKGKYEFISKRAAESWFNNYILTTNESISGYPLYGLKGFRPGSLLRAMDNTTWYIKDDERLLIATPDFFLLGFPPAVKVSNKELFYHNEGEPISDII